MPGYYSGVELFVRITQQVGVDRDDAIVDEM